jgi:hypothetical protein
MEAVVPGRTETDAGVAFVEGEVVGLDTDEVGATEGIVPPPPPPLHATNALTRTMSARSEGRKRAHVSVNRKRSTARVKRATSYNRCAVVPKIILSIHPL